MPNECAADRGKSFVSEWHKSYAEAHSAIVRNLYVVTPELSQLLGLCARTLRTSVLVDFKAYKHRETALDFEIFRNDVMLDSEKAQDKLMASYAPLSTLYALFFQLSAFNSLSSFTTITRIRMVDFGSQKVESLKSF